VVELADEDVVAVLTRAPSAGGKTRLFSALRRPPDPALLRALFLDTLDATDLPGVTRVVCFTPPGAGDEMRSLVPAGVQLMEQSEGDLGARMLGVFEELLASGASGVVLIGSDLPLLERSTVLGACRHLKEDPEAVVIGAASDGGYCLLGATQRPAALMADMAWGRSDVLAQTLARAEGAGLRVVQLPATRDVDTPDDLQAVAEAASRGVRTRAWAQRNC
jgi:rSAM/selenodomain-associated transferase 1